MNKVLIFLSIVSLALLLTSQVALAGGDKVRGEKGEGTTSQECVRFDGCPYGTENP